MATAATTVADLTAGSCSRRWWEVEVCCAPERQISVLKRLLPPGFAFYVRERTFRNVETVRAFVPEERTSATRFAAALFSLAMEAPVE